MRITSETMSARRQWNDILNTKEKIIYWDKKKISTPEIYTKQNYLSKKNPWYCDEHLWYLPHRLMETVIFFSAKNL